MDVVEKTLFVWYVSIRDPSGKIVIYNKYGLEPDASYCPLCEEAGTTIEGRTNCKECMMYGKWDAPDGGKKLKCYGASSDGVKTYYQLWEDAFLSKKEKDMLVYANFVYKNLKRELDNGDN